MLVASASSFINSTIAGLPGSRRSEHPLRVATAARMRNHRRRLVVMRPTHLFLRGTCPTPERPGCLRLPQKPPRGCWRAAVGARSLDVRGEVRLPVRLQRVRLFLLARTHPPMASLAVISRTKTITTTAMTSAPSGHPTARK